MESPKLESKCRIVVHWVTLGRWGLFDSSEILVKSSFPFLLFVFFFLLVIEETKSWHPFAFIFFPQSHGPVRQYMDTMFSSKSKYCI